MPYKVSFIYTKANVSVPDLYEWLGSLPTDYMDSLTVPYGPFPNDAGKTPTEIMDARNARANASLSNLGLVTSTVTHSSDGLVKTVEFVYPNKEQADTAEQLGSTTTAAKYLQDMYLTENNIQTQITKTEI